MQTDPIADMLTRVRNASRVRLVRVSMPESRMKRDIARVLKERGFIREYSSDDDPKKPTLTISLRYGHENEPTIEGIERISRPGRRVYVNAREVYVNAREIPRVRSGLGVAILSTPKGILSDEEARTERVGGEFVARVW
jgi:small subunit ribosomal protein S8